MTTAIKTVADIICHNIDKYIEINNLKPYQTKHSSWLDKDEHFMTSSIQKCFKSFDNVVMDECPGLKTWKRFILKDETVEYRLNFGVPCTFPYHAGNIGGFYNIDVKIFKVLGNLEINVYRAGEYRDNSKYNKDLRDPIKYKAIKEELSEFLTFGTIG